MHHACVRPVFYLRRRGSRAFDKARRRRYHTYIIMKSANLVANHQVISFVPARTLIAGVAIFTLTKQQARTRGRQLMNS